jgi:N6-adenosine-specific RNA methylase IME4
MTSTDTAKPDVGTMTELVKYEAACRMLAEAVTADEVKHVRDVAMAMKLLARQAKNRQAEADAYELRVRAERKLGEMIVEQKATVGLATGGQPYQRKSTGAAAVPVAVQPVPETGSAAAPVSKPGTLAEAGIDKKLSSKAQKMSAIPPAAFEDMVKDGREQVQRGAEKRVMRQIDIAERRASFEARAEVGGKVEDLHALTQAGRRFAVILADPPWAFETYSAKGKDVAGLHYDTMTPDEIKALPVEALAAKDCVLLMWTVWPSLHIALDVIKAWGFDKAKTAAFVWAKQGPGGEGWHMGQGYYTRANTEFCLLATRGSPQRDAFDVHQLIVSPVREHSRKPDEAHQRIERLLAGPYLEIFARAERPGWVTWGNEVKPPQIATITPLKPIGRMKWLSIEKLEADIDELPLDENGVPVQPAWWDDSADEWFELVEFKGCPPNATGLPDSIPPAT